MSAPTSDQRLYGVYLPVLALRASGSLQAVSVFEAERIENSVWKGSCHQEVLADLTCCTTSLGLAFACKILFRLMTYLL